MIFKLLLAGFLSISTGNAFAESIFIGHEAGGKGSICNYSRCYTLIEAGLRINTRQFKIDKKVSREIRRILDLLSFNSKLTIDFVESANSQYVVLEAVDPARYDAYERNVRNVSGSAEYGGETFNLIYTQDDEKAYLLPNFNRMSITGRAIAFIHGAIRRNLKLKQKDILLIDEQLYLLAISKYPKKFDQRELANLFRQFDLFSPQGTVIWM